MTATPPVGPARIAPPAPTDTNLGTIQITVNGQTKTYSVHIETVDADGNLVANNGAFKTHEKAKELIQILANQFAKENQQLFNDREVVLHAGNLPLEKELTSESKAEVYKTLEKKPPITENNTEPFMTKGEKIDPTKVDPLLDMLKKTGEDAPKGSAFTSAWQEAFGDTPHEVTDLPTDETAISAEKCTELRTKIREILKGYYDAKDEPKISLENWDPTKQSLEEYIKAQVEAEFQKFDEYKIKTIQDLWLTIFENESAALNPPKHREDAHNNHVRIALRQNSDEDSTPRSGSSDSHESDTSTVISEDSLEPK